MNCSLRRIFVLTANGLSERYTSGWRGQKEKLGSTDTSHCNYVTENELTVANTFPGVLTPRLKTAASSNSILLFDLGHECALFSTERNSGLVWSGQLTTEKFSDQVGLGRAVLKKFRAGRIGLSRAKIMSGQVEFGRVNRVHNGFQAIVTPLLSTTYDDIDFHRSMNFTYTTQK